MELKPQYKNSLIYAFTGLGKTKAAENNSNLIETDKLLCKIYGCTHEKLYDTMVFQAKNYPSLKEYKMMAFKQDIDRYKNGGYTVLTSNEETLSKATHAFLPDSIDFVLDRVANLKRPNPYTKDPEVLKTNLKRIETKLKNLSIPITYISEKNYLSDLIFG